MVSQSKQTQHERKVQLPSLILDQLGATTNKYRVVSSVCALSWLPAREGRFKVVVPTRGGFFTEMLDLQVKHFPQ